MELALIALVFLPAIVGLVAFGAGSFLLVAGMSKEGAGRVWLIVIGGALLAVGLGVGACYGALALS